MQEIDENSNLIADSKSEDSKGSEDSFDKMVFMSSFGLLSTLGLIIFNSIYKKFHLYSEKKKKKNI